MQRQITPIARKKVPPTRSGGTAQSLAPAEPAATGSSPQTAASAILAAPRSAAVAQQQQHIHVSSPPMESPLLVQSPPPPSFGTQKGSSVATRNTARQSANLPPPASAATSQLRRRGETAPGVIAAQPLTPSSSAIERDVNHHQPLPSPANASRLLTSPPASSGALQRHSPASASSLATHQRSVPAKPLSTAPGGATAQTSLAAEHPPPSASSVLRPRSPPRSPPPPSTSKSSDGGAHLVLAPPPKFALLSQSASAVAAGSVRVGTKKVVTIQDTGDVGNRVGKATSRHLTGSSSSSSSINRAHQTASRDRPHRPNSAPNSEAETAAAHRQLSSVSCSIPYSQGEVGMVGCGLLQNRFMIVTGGIRRDNTVLNSIACFDILFQRWLVNESSSSSPSPPEFGGPNASSPSPIVSLPEPLYGHCCITHGQRNVWLVGGMSGQHVSRTIVRLTIEIQYAHGSSVAATPQASPAVVGGNSNPFLDAPPLVTGGSMTSSPIDPRREAVSFSITSLRCNQLPFPVGFAACVMLQGTLEPVALIMGGLSTVRDSECGDTITPSCVSGSTTAAAAAATACAGRRSSKTFPSPPRCNVADDLASSPVSNASYDSSNGASTLNGQSLTNGGGSSSAAAAAALPQTTQQPQQQQQDTRRMGITNRVFALNLDDCSMLRVAQTGEYPSPRMMAAAAPLLRRDVSGSYGNIIYFGGITSTQAGATAATSALLKKKNGRSFSSSSQTQQAGGAQKKKEDDAQDIFVASVAHNPKARTYSLHWAKFTRRSEADPWPSPVAGHSLCALPGYTLLIGGNVVPANAGGGADDTVTAPRSNNSSALAVLFDAASGVACSEVALTRFPCGPPHHQTHDSVPTSLMPTGLIYHRAVVIASNERDGDGGALPQVLIVGGSTAAAASAIGSDADNELGASSTRQLMPFIQGLHLPKTTQVMQPPPEEHVDINLHIEMEVMTSSTVTSNATTTNTTRLCWETSTDRDKLCIDQLVEMISDRLLTDTAAAEKITKILSGHQQNKNKLRTVVLHNLLLYTKGSDGERVPLSSDMVLKRMVARCGLGALPMLAAFIPPIQNYQRYREIGRGSFGKVYSAYDQNGKFFTAKRVKYVPERRDALLREIRLLRGLDHPNIVKYLGVEILEDKCEAYIFMEYVKMDGCGDLSSFLRQLQPSMQLIRCHFRQVLAALTYLHSYNIVHQDIKGANVLVGTDVTKLADFGTARQLVADDKPDDNSHHRLSTDGGSSTMDDGHGSDECGSISVSPRLSTAGSTSGVNRREAREGTAVFMAPEVLIGDADEEMTTASDIWSLGCLLIEISTGRLPWVAELSGVNRDDALIQLRCRLMRGERPAYPTRPDFPQSAVQFLDDCLVFNPKLRKTAAQLLEHPFITDDLDEASSRQMTPSPFSGATTTAANGGMFPPCRQPSDLVDDTLEGMVEPFADASLSAVPQADTVAPAAAVVRRGGGLPSAVRHRRTGL